MDLKTEDLITVEIDLSSEFGKMNLGIIPNDFLDKISKFDEQSDIETIFLPVEEHTFKCIDEVSSKEFQNSKINTCSSDDKLCVNDPKEKDSVDVPGIRKDINGNVSIADENLNNLILKYGNLELSDSDNEEDEEEVSKLTEKGPDRGTAQRRRKRDHNYLTRRDSYDRSQFKSETLRHLSGSSHVQQHETPMPNQLFHSVDVSNILSRNQTTNCVYNSTSPLDFTSVAISANISSSKNAITIPSSQNNSLYGNFRPRFLNDSLVSQSKNISISCNNDLLYDSASNSVSSPESGYDTSYSITGSPTQNLNSPECFSDLNVENVNEQEIIDIVLNIEIENPPHPEKPVHNLIQFDLDGENPTEKIVHFLKDIPTVGSEQPHTVNCEANTECVQAVLNQVPLTSSLDFVETALTDLSTPAVSSEINCKQVSEELNDLLSIPSSKTSFEQVLKELNNLSTVTEAYSIPNDLSAADSYNLSCEPLVKEPRNLHLVASEVSCEYVPLVNNTGVIKSSTPIVPMVLCQSTQNSSETRLACKPLRNEAKNALRKSLCNERCYAVQSAILRKINKDKQRNKEVKVIYIEDEADDKTSEKQTNLHKAIINGNIVEAYCLVEANEMYKKDPRSKPGDINLRDKHNKTALDYAVEKKLTLLVDFLKENNACPGLNI